MCILIICKVHNVGNWLFVSAENIVGSPAPMIARHDGLHTGVGAAAVVAPWTGPGM